ncbi:MAG: HNH endonuclease [Planctomyces sp.]
MNRLAATVSRALKEQQKSFRISHFKSQNEHHPQELCDAVRIVYRRLLEKIWSDEVITEKENLQLLWVKECLELSDSETITMRLEFAERHFRNALAQAMDDGFLSEQEEAKLAHIAKSVGESSSRFARRFFRKEGEAFLRGIFGASIEDGYLSREEWQSLAATSHKLGISTEELLKAVAKPAAEFVEHVLADAKAEGTITREQESQIIWLMATLRIDADFVKYAREEMRILLCLDEIAQGRLPSLAKPEGLEFRSGEIVHAIKKTRLIVVRQLKSGAHRDVHDGTIIMMDSRMVFQSNTLAQSFNYRKLVSHRGGEDWIEFQVEQKPMWGLRFSEPDATIYPILSKAASLANQTSVRKGGDGPSRHIPRDVRQRVWTRYGGRCAECNANDYLEYDHIIPVSKGGSNNDANVQLLCRRCNLKKSDHI